MMKDKLMTEMSAEEFDAMIEKRLERDSQDMGDLPAPLFYQALRDFFSVAKDNVEETFDLHCEVVDSQLTLHLPAVEQRDYVMVRNNEIIIDNLRLVLHMM